MVCLDLENAYGSVLHALIRYAIDLFLVLQRFRDFLMAYYDQFWMRFATYSDITEWHKLEVGIPMGCAISPILFVLDMEFLICVGSGHGKEVELAASQNLPAMFPFMDDLTVVQQSAAGAVEVLE